ncbi:MAG: Mov34/MPN/PAD-1 family protein [Acidobacteriota bacterium]
MAEVSIRRPVLERMIGHARRDYPLECCGLLSGRGRVIDEIVEATNQRQSRTQFAVPARELVSFMRAARNSSKRLLGLYHSHPRSEARPSQRDIAEFFYHGASYWILSLKRRVPEVRCFRWDQTAFEETAFLIVDP